MSSKLHGGGDTSSAIRITDVIEDVSTDNRNRIFDESLLDTNSQFSKYGRYSIIQKGDIRLNG